MKLNKPPKFDVRELHKLKDGEALNLAFIVDKAEVQYGDIEEYDVHQIKEMLYILGILGDTINFARKVNFYGINPKEIDYLKLKQISEYKSLQPTRD